MSKWLGVTSPENWKVCVKHGVWGASDDYESLMRELKTGDQILVYLIKYKLAGIFKVTKPYFHSKKKLWKNGVYPHRIRISPIMHARDPIDIEEWYKTKFEPKTGKAPQGYFQRSLRKFHPDVEDEFEMFKSLLDQNPGQPQSELTKKTFSDLHDYLVNDMDKDMQANYQPVMIRVMLESGGKADKDLIAEAISQVNSEQPKGGFRNIPVYDTLENNGVVVRRNNDFILNVDELTPDQRDELVLLCRWKTFNQLLPLEDLIKAFDKNRRFFNLQRPSVQEILVTRDRFVEDYSEQKILALSLDEYVQGKPDPRTGETNHSTFCFRLERAVPGFGNIWGTPADKFGIYYSKEKRNYVYKRHEIYHSPQEAFAAIKGELQTILHAGKQFQGDRDWIQLAQTLEKDYNIERHVRSRILSIYFPEEFPQIHASDAIEKVLLAFSVPDSEIRKGLFLNQARLMEVKNNHPIMKNWSTIEFSHFVWESVMERVKRKDLRQKPTVGGSYLGLDNYFILRTQAGSEWHDKEGEEYHYGSNVPQHRKLVAGSHVIFDRNMDGLIQYTGYGEIESVTEENRNRKTAEGKSILDKIAKIKGYEGFPSPIVRSTEVEEILENLPGYNNQHSIRPITYEVYHQIVDNEIEPKEGWTFDIDEAVDEILQRGNEKELALNRSLVKRIIIHLKSGKNVVLVGPPGVGKTDLAQRISRVIGKRVIGNALPLEAVASDEWSRHEIIGGFDIDGKFQQGWISKASSENRWLLIDEFNRANMNKAFGEMFLAIEYKKIMLRPGEAASYGDEIISIPDDFRMICTMNDFDKNLLLTELSYGLISRFAFVSINPDTNEEPRVVEQRIKSDLRGNMDVYDSCRDQISRYYAFINKVRMKRNIGIRTSIDVINYLLASSTVQSNEDDKLASLNNALCDYVLPQFDRLDRETIDHVLNISNTLIETSHFEPFRRELSQAQDRLQKAAGWLVKEDDK